MALGNTPQNQQQQNNGGQTYFAPETKSPLSLKNAESDLASELSFSYWKGMLCIAISEKLPRKNGEEFDQYDRENAVKIYLNPGKARIFKKSIELYKEQGLRSTGVTNGGGNTQIAIVNGKEYFNVKNDVVIIRKIDANGAEIGSAAYEFNTSDAYYYAINNIDMKDTSAGDFTYFDSIEMDIFSDVIEEYYKCSGYAVAATVNDTLSYRINDIRKGVSSLLDNAGISSGSKPRSNNGSFFNNRAASSSNGASSSNAVRSEEKGHTLEEILGE